VKPGRIRNFLFRLFALGFGLFMALFMLEVVFKILHFIEAGKENKLLGQISKVSDIPGVRYEIVPNITTVTPRSPVLIRFNNFGFRGPDVSPEKPANTYRIAVLGDSIAFGQPRPYEELFSSMLAERLNEKPGGKKVEVINASLSGRDTWEEFAILKHRIIPLDPDLVILQICLNDHVRLPFPKENSTRGVFGEQSWWHYSSLLRALDKRSKKFHKFHLRMIKKLRLDRRSAERVILDHYIDPRQMVNIEPHWPEWSKVLLDFKNLSNEHGAKVLFLVFPLDYQIKRYDHETAPLLTQFTQENNIPYLDLICALGHADPWPLKDYTHPNQYGHVVVAEELEQFITAHILSPDEG